jgi:hypothetical protein
MTPLNTTKEVRFLTFARFRSESGSAYFIEVHEDRITALVPEELGIRIPFEFGQEAGEPDLLKWDLSYLYAELWSIRERGPRLIAPSLPEFETDRHRPNSLRFPLPLQSVHLLEEQRRSGDIELVLHIQATLIGSVERDRVPDAGRRRTLEALGLERDIFGPSRRSDDVTIRINRSLWAEEVLPQWDVAELESVAANTRLDIRALARSLYGATPGGDFEDVLEQCRDPIVGL